MAQLYFYYSTMNAGKSTSLLQSAYNYKERGMNALLFTAFIDDRYATGTITSRIGLQATAQLFNEATHLFDEISSLHNQEKIDCVLLDEAQFLKREQVLQLCHVVDHLNIPVLCYGLRTDFQGELFEGSQYLLAWAEKLSELKTVCHCGSKAIMVVRTGADGRVITEGSQVEIGGNERYVSLCRHHFHQAQTLSTPT